MRLKDYIKKVLLDLGEYSSRTYIELNVVIYDRDEEIYVDTTGSIPEYCQCKAKITFRADSCGST